MTSYDVTSNDVSVERHSDFELDPCLKRWNPSYASRALTATQEQYAQIEATKNRVRDIFYWPSLSRDVEKLVTQCSGCNTYKRHSTFTERATQHS